MSASSLLDDHVPKQQCKCAVEALLSHAAKHEEKKAETQLFSGKEQNVWLVVNTKVMHPEKKLKPARIPVKYPIVDPRTESVCLITKDPQREYKDLIAKEGIKFISRVVDIRHLKGKWKPFEARRMLLKENGLFLADERVVPLLPGLLGKIFFQAKKQPIPVCITRKDLKGELERAISSTYFHQNRGTCSSVKIGIISQKPAQVLVNLETALPEVVKHIKGGWDNIQSFFIKTNSSAALPIWQCNLGAESGGRWEGLVASLSDGEGEEMDDAAEGQSSEDEEMEVEQPTPTVSKGKKRTAEEAAGEAESDKSKPKKKAQAADKTTTSVEAATATAPPTPAKGKGKGEGKDKGKGKAVDSSPAPSAEAAPAASEPAKKKRRKSALEPTTPLEVPTPAPAAVTDESADAPPEGKKRKRSKSQAAPPAVAPTPSSSQPAPPVAPDATAPAKKEKRKKVRASLAAAADSSDATATAPPPASVKASAPTDPVTPAASKKARASAVDFFDEAAPTPATGAVPPNPPNTPADGLVGETPAKRRKRTKSAVVADTPVTNAIAKLAAQPEADATAGTPSGRKPRHRKTKEGVRDRAAQPAPEAQTAAVDPDAAPVEKKRKRKQKQKEKDDAGAADGVDKPVPAASTVSAEEIKQKRSVAGVEKKKEKVVGGKPTTRSAKDEVVGKKSKKL